MPDKLRILFAAAEAAPFTKVGGLADVASALPKALSRMGHDVRLVTPRYRTTRVERPTAAVLGGPLVVQVMGRSCPVNVSQTTLNSEVTTYLLENEEYFGRRPVYGEPDDLERFAAFSRAVLEVPRRLGWAPDILHCHDWHSAPAVAFLRKDHAGDPVYSSTASVFTIHNLAYQGQFDGYFEERAGFAKYTRDLDACCRLSEGNMMALGIFYSDVVSTVSETYSQEILTPEHGEGMDGLLKMRKVKPYGIVNGIDYEEFDPAKDRCLVANYDVSSLGKRALNKKALQEKAGLPVDNEKPLFGMVGRLAAQKGVDLVAQAMKGLVNLDAQVVILGSGEQEYVDMLKEAVAPYPKAVWALMSFDLTLAQLIYGGCDIFLMPSRFEPCGLGQMIAMRYGAVPLVRHTGGLVDTVQDCSPDLSHGNGFVFQRYAAEDLLEAARRAVGAFRTRRDAWRGLMLRDMRSDLSWTASAARYESMYRDALRLKASGAPVTAPE